MDPIRSFCAKLRSLAVTLDGETARLQRALTGEAGDFEDCAGRMLHDLHSEVRTLKDDVITLLDKANLESQESIGFIKATKVLMKKNSADIMKIRELFQKYGYNRCAKNSVGEQGATSSQPEPTQEECLQKPDVKGELSDPVVPDCSVPEKVPSSPQLSDFGLERYLIPQVPPNPPQAVNNQKEEPKMLTPSSQQSLVQVLKTPEFALNMDDGECLTPKLEHFGVSEHTMCLNEDYTLGCKHVKRTNYASEEALETEPVPSDSATPGLVDQHPEKNDAEYTSPLAPTFCTPGLKIPSIKNNEDSSSTDCPWSQTSSSSGDLHVQACAPSSVVSSRRRSEGQAAPSSPGVSAHEHLLRTPTPPRVTAIPDDVLQILSKYNPNLATTPVAVKAMPPSKAFLTRCEGQNI